MERMRAKGKTKRVWQREQSIKTMVCVLCGDEIMPRKNILVTRFRGKIVLCNICEKVMPAGFLTINEDPFSHLLGGY